MASHRLSETYRQNKRDAGAAPQGSKQKTFKGADPAKSCLVEMEEG